MRTSPLILVLMLFGCALSLAAKERQVEIFHWVKTSKGVQRESLATVRMPVQGDSANLKLAQEKEGLPAHEVKLSFRHLGSPKAEVQLSSPETRHTAGPSLRFLEAESIVRIAPVAGGYHFATLAEDAEDRTEAPLPGTWEIEVESPPARRPAHARVKSLWGQRLAVAMPDRLHEVFPPIN